jgi:hypothetical protein
MSEMTERERYFWYGYHTARLLTEKSLREMDVHRIKANQQEAIIELKKLLKDEDS